jgi:hypothetical protein
MTHIWPWKVTHPKADRAGHAAGVGFWYQFVPSGENQMSFVT